MNDLQGSGVWGTIKCMTLFVTFNQEIWGSGLGLTGSSAPKGSREMSFLPPDCSPPRPLRGARLVGDGDLDLESFLKWEQEKIRAQR